MDDRDFFDNLAPIWDENETMSTPERVNIILDYFNLKVGDKILDLGTGTGILLPYIAERIGREGEITAVDYSEGMLERAKRKYDSLVPHPQFLNLDFENEAIPGEYDKIIMYCVYPHLHTPIDTLKWLEKVNLKKRGEIIIAFPCGPDFINNIHKERHSEGDLLPTAKDLAEKLRREGIRAEALSPDYVVVIRNFNS